MQDGQLLAAACPRSINRFLNFLGVSHASGNDHWLAGAGNVLDQRQVDRLERGNFVCRRVQIFQQVDGASIKR
ncbi:hypothetical protein D3C87_1864470 [compost metagenome]